MICDLPGSRCVAGSDSGVREHVWEIVCLISSCWLFASRLLDNSDWPGICSKKNMMLVQYFRVDYLLCCLQIFREAKR